MKFKFKIQPHQTAAIDAVIDCFEGQPKGDLSRYRIDPDRQLMPRYDIEDGFKNNNILIDDSILINNIQSVQNRQNLRLSKNLSDFRMPNKKGLLKPVRRTYKPGARINIDIEMETGTGKTYCYIKTMFEMNKRFGWSKFIVMVPSIAIREGVYNSFHSTSDHFVEHFGKKSHFFIYNSRHLHEIESFSSDAGINVMIINVQAFNARGADNRRIYEELDAFQSRRPIDVLSANQPILILDEPQKMEGRATLEALPKFNPLMILRYSATHRTQHCLIHRLDALDAYNQKLVKKISVHGIRSKGTGGKSAYLFLESIEISDQAPIARIEMEVKLKSGKIRRRLKRLKCDTNLFEVSNGLEQYRNHIISDIDARKDVVEFKDGKSIFVGEVIGDIDEKDIRRLQIRETIKAHMEKEKRLFGQGTKVLSLFFIDEVKKYRDYDQSDEKGEYARIFEDEYEILRREYLSEPIIDDQAYRSYLLSTDPAQTHSGYFSIDRKGRMTNPNVKKRGVEKGISDDINAYDLILKNKEQLLSFEEPTRFIFSHSALREGWDNPNVFVICILKRSFSNISRRQEVGRGLRISVDKYGMRNDHSSVVHEINILSIIANESYEEFVQGLQTEIIETLSARPREASIDYFKGKLLQTSEGSIEVSKKLATQIYQYLVRNGFIDDTNRITSSYHHAKANNEFPNMGSIEYYRDPIIDLIDSVFDDSKLPVVENGRRRKTNRLNANIKKKEFQELWSRINKRAVYKVNFDSIELIDKCVIELNNNLIISPSQYIIVKGKQKDQLTDKVVLEKSGFTDKITKTVDGIPVHSLVKYDIVGQISENAEITRKSAASILSQINPNVFEQFKNNPELFISKCSSIIKEEKGSVVVQCLVYDEIDKSYDIDIFINNQFNQDFSRSTGKLKNHIYDFAITDSDKEKEIANELDQSSEVSVYAKLPRGFVIPTPVGNYNPDWAISFKAGNRRFLYFVTETKGSLSSMQIKKIEDIKIKCAEKFFNHINQHIEKGRISYGVIANYDDLLDLVKSVTEV